MPTGLKNPVEQVRHYSNIKIAYPRGQVKLISIGLFVFIP